jgi:hypothetical protein
MWSDKRLEGVKDRHHVVFLLSWIFTGRKAVDAPVAVSPETCVEFRDILDLPLYLHMGVISFPPSIRNRFTLLIILP